MCEYKLSVCLGWKEKDIYRCSVVHSMQHHMRTYTVEQTDRMSHLEFDPALLGLMRKSSERKALDECVRQSTRD